MYACGVAGRRLAASQLAQEASTRSAMSVGLMCSRSSVVLPRLGPPRHAVQTRAGLATSRPNGQAVLASPHLASTCQASLAALGLPRVVVPCRAPPNPTSPDQAEPCLTLLAYLSSQAVSCPACLSSSAQPCRATPNRCTPCPARPRLARPYPAAPLPPTHAAPSRGGSNLGMPGRALSSPAWPCPSEPRPGSPDPTAHCRA